MTRVLAFTFLVACAPTKKSSTIPVANVVATIPALTVGQATPGTLTVTPRRQSEAMNPNYPSYSVTLADVPGLVIDKPIGIGTVTQEQLVFPITITATRAGTFTVDGRIQYCVLSGSSCLIAREQFSISVTSR
jgi:hypothetical protein